MYLKLLGPFYTGFKVAPGNRVGLPAAYTQFWDEQVKNRIIPKSFLDCSAMRQQKANNSTLHNATLSFEVEYEHATPRRHMPLYSVIDEDTLPAPVEILTFKVSDEDHCIDAHLKYILGIKYENYVKKRLEVRQSPTSNCSQNTIALLDKQITLLDQVQTFNSLTVQSDELEIRLYDYEIGIFSAAIEINSPERYYLPGADREISGFSKYRVFLDLVRDIGIEFATQMIQIIYERYLSSYLRDLVGKADSYFKSPKIIQFESVMGEAEVEHFAKYQKPFKKRVLHFFPTPKLPCISRALAGKPDVLGDSSVESYLEEFKQKSQVLWITRTLIFHDLYKSTDSRQSDLVSKDLIKDFSRYWLKDTGVPENKEDADESHQEIFSLDEIENNANTYSMTWLNYLFREEVDLEEMKDAFEALHLAQYYYAALEKLNNDLHEIIGAAFSPTAEEDIRKLSQELKRLTNRTNMLITEYREIQKYLKRNKRKKLNQIMAGWYFEDIISNAESKLNICLQRVDSLSTTASNRNNFFSEVLLLVIGTLAIIDLSMSLSEYGRTLNTDATLGVRDESTWILNIFAQSPTDIMLLICILLIAVCVAVYVRQRLKTWL